MSGLTAQARAKLNLSLDVLGGRGDGFHELRMVMQAAELSDEVYVELREPGYFRAETNRSYIPSDERNVAIKAAKAYFELAGMDSGVYVRITKRIPVCAGLGGGSSDAAAVIRVLNKLTGGKLDGGQLHAAAMKAGSDVPFCLMGGTALAEGRGEVLTPLPPLPRVPVVICIGAEGRGPVRRGAQDVQRVRGRSGQALGSGGGRDKAAAAGGRRAGRGDERLRLGRIRSFRRRGARDGCRPEREERVPRGVPDFDCVKKRKGAKKALPCDRRALFRAFS